jgi:hypothetical protein
MKIRQKIAMLLAAAMTLTAVPMVTMAQSDTKIVSGIQIGSKDDTVSNSLRVEMKDTTTTAVEFYVTLANAEFVSTATGTIVDTSTPAVTLGSWRRTGNKELTVNLLANAPKSNFYIPVNAVLKGGDATVAVDGAGTIISDYSPVVFARTSDGTATVTVADAESIFTEAKTVAKITIDEPYRGTLSNANSIDISVRHSDYKISDYVVNYERGFGAGAGTVPADLDSDTGVLSFKPVVGYSAASSAPGRITVELELTSTTKNPSTGALNVRVSGKDVTSTTIKVAEIKEFGTIVEMDDKKVVDVVAGQSEEITFTVKESVEDTFVGSGRGFDVEFDNAFLLTYKVNTTATEAQAKTDLEAVFPTSGDFEYADYILDEDDYVVGASFKLNNVATSGETELEFKDIPVYAALGAKGDVTVTVNGRALGDEASTVAMNIKEAVSITASPMTIKVGLKEQVGGKLVITEADAGIIKQGEFIYVKIDDSDTTLKLKDEGDIEVTSGDLVLDLDATKIDGGILKIKVKRESTEASVITIKDVEVYTDRTVPQGTFDVKIGGKALAEDWSTSDVATVKDLKVEGFIIVGTPNTEDITANGLKKGTASFVIGSSKYVVNGVEAEMDGAVYLDNGRTMVPVRYVANALGVPATDIFFAAGTATVLAGSKTVSLTVGDKVAKLNGVAARTMVSAPVVKDGRTYVPVAEIGALLGVEATWDSAAQTATFTNK